MNLETERLKIRPVCIGDKESMFRYRSDPDTNKYLSLIPESIDDMAEFIHRSSGKINVPETWFQTAIIEKTSGELIGDAGLHFLDSGYQKNQVEIGYTLDKAYRGKGFATEALKEIIDYLIYTLKKHRITASIDPVNTDSIRLMERLGFRKEAHFIESAFFHGEWVDDVVYAVLAKDWKNMSR